MIVNVLKKITHMLVIFLRIIILNILYVEKQ